MNLKQLPGRQDMTLRKAEAWKPPIFAPHSSGWGRVMATVRRFVDLQAGSLWNDLSQLLPTCHGTVLDVGCGAQPYRPLLPTDATYIGIDTADALEHFGYEIPDTRYYHGDVWPVDDRSIDFVLCTETLEHVSEPAPFLAQVSRCLKTDGQLLLTVPFAARWHYIPYDYWRYTPSTLSRLLKEAGMREVAVYARGNVVTVACYKVMAMILRLLLPQDRSPWVRLMLRLLGLPLLPVFGLLSLLGQASLRFDGGDDCLGYTVVALK